MAIRIVTLGLAALSASLAVSSSSHRVPGSLKGQAAHGAGSLHISGSRQGAPHEKLDGALADVTRHAAWAHSANRLAALHGLAPAARFRLASDGVTPLVAVDAVTTGNPEHLKAALESLGLERAAVYSNDVGGWLPVDQLATAAARDEVHSLRAAMARTRAGAVTSQGDFVQQSAKVRTSDSLTGSGVTVGVLSDSFNCYAVYAKPGSGVPASGYAGYAYNGFTANATDDVATGDLPTSVNVLKEADCLNYGAPQQTPFGDEGRAMLQIVHDVAPGAGLAFYTAENSEADFANGIQSLASSAGATVIADDVGYFDEPFYQDGLLAQAIDSVEAAGVAYFSAAGNDGDAAYENTAPSFATLSTTAPNSGEYLLNVDTTGATTTTALPVTIGPLVPGQLVAIVVQWDQPYVTGAAGSGGATSQLDLCITGATSIYTIENNDGTAETCTGPNPLGSDPYQILIIDNPANAAGSTPEETLNVMVGLAGGTNAPGRVKIAVLTDGQTTPAPLSQFVTPNPVNSSTLQGHPGASGALTVGAAFYFDTPACGSSPAALEPFSSVGGAPILFDTTGARLATPVTRQKPDVVGPDGGNDTFLGFTLATAGITGSNGLLSTGVTECQNLPSYPNFFGSSAATPHVAGIAALMREANSTLTPTQIYTSLRKGALSMGGGSTPNFDSGYGFVQADAAFALIPPGTPMLSASASSVTLGTPATLTWSSVNASGCSASGGWSGTLAASGTQTVTPAALGATAYTLTCSNAAGASSPASVSVAATAAVATASGGSHGGGQLDWLFLAALGSFGAVRLARPAARLD